MTSLHSRASRAAPELGPACTDTQLPGGSQEELASTGDAVAVFAEGHPSNRNFHKYPMLADRWFALCEKTGLDGRAGWTALADAYGDPARAYHNMNHIGDCLPLSSFTPTACAGFRR